MRISGQYSFTKGSGSLNAFQYLASEGYKWIAAYDDSIVYVDTGLQDYYVVNDGLKYENLECFGSGLCVATQKLT